MSDLEDPRTSRLLATLLEEPPPRVWRRLQLQMAAPRRRPVWIRWALAAAAGLTLMGGAFSLHHPPMVALQPPPRWADPQQSLLAGPGREDADLRSLRVELDALEQDMKAF